MSLLGTAGLKKENRKMENGASKDGGTTTGITTNEAYLRSVNAPDDGTTKKRVGGRPPRPSTKSTPVNFRRLQVTLSDRGFERLEKLREMTDAISQADVIREALSFYEAAVEEVTAGKRIVCENPKNPSDRLLLKLKVS
jgi:hypothetical protein